MARRCAGLGASVRRLCVVSRGVGRVGRLQLVSTDRIWEHGGNCTTRRFDTPATRRSDASNGAKPPFGPPGAPSMAGWRLWRDEAWAGLGGCSSFQRPGYGSTGGIALQGGSTRRRHAVAMRLMVQNPRWAAGRGRRAGGELLVGGPSRHGSPVVHTVTRCSAGKPPDMHAGGGVHARNRGFVCGSGPGREQG